ncbi:MAG: Fic family protein [Synechococcaceae cyanobacterium]
MAAIPAGNQEQQPDDPIVLFQAADGQVSLDVRLEADTVWLSQAQMAELFGRERSVITRHIGNVFREGELAEAQRAIATLRADLVGCGEATPLFGQDNRQALAGILGAIEQIFDGQSLYPTAQLRAAHLLYFVIKDYPFADGNKRIDTLLFLEFLRRNQLLLLVDGQHRIADNGMAALALLIAESHPQQKDLMIRLVMALLEDRDGRFVRVGRPANALSPPLTLSRRRCSTAWQLTGRCAWLAAANCASR